MYLDSIDSNKGSVKVKCISLTKLNTVKTQKENVLRKSSYIVYHLSIYFPHFRGSLEPTR